MDLNYLKILTRRKKCTTKRCPRPQQKGLYCYRCAHRNYKAKYPYHYYYYQARSNAKRRGIPFLLSLAQFKSIWQAHPKAWKEKLEGNTYRTWTLDRVDNNLPYQLDNIQVLTLHANVIKYHYHDKFVVEKSWRKPSKPSSDQDCPF